MGAIHAAASSLLLAAVCAALAVGVTAEDGPARAQSQASNPALARLEIDVWPEYDRESAVLVILRAEVAPDVTLPAEVSVRIPASSGGPAAVAEADSANSQLLTVPYATAGVQIDFVTIRFQVTRPIFHMEFYDPISTDTPERAYRYLWPGDFSVGQVVVQLQEPATSVDVTVTPDLGAPAAEADRLNYREADLGALEAGKPLAVEVGYSKTDPRTTSDIMGFQQATPPPSQSDDGTDWTSAKVLVPVGVAAVAVIAGAAALVWQRMLAAGPAAPVSRGQRRRAAAPAGRFCRQCAAPLDPGDRFCAACGHSVKRKG